MNSALTATVALAGLFFSLSLALLLEELLFGIVFRLMACSQRIAAAVKSKQSTVKRSVGPVEAQADRTELVI